MLSTCHMEPTVIIWKHHNELVYLRAIVMLVFLRNNVKRSLIDWAAYLATVVTLITLLEYIHFLHRWGTNNVIWCLSCDVCNYQPATSQHKGLMVHCICEQTTEWLQSCNYHYDWHGTRVVFLTCNNTKQWSIHKSIYVDLPVFTIIDSGSISPNIILSTIN